MNKIYNLLGLAQKAGKISSGFEIVQNNLASKKTKLLILSTDISEESKKNLLTLCKKNGITAIILCNKTTMGVCVGKAARIALSINDKGFSDAVIKEVKRINASADNLNHLEVVEWPK